MIEIRDAGHKGRGVFACKPFKKGQVVETCPAIISSRTEWEKLEETIFSNYVFDWDGKSVALALGLGSLYNHSANPNAEVEVNLDEKTIRYVALRRIEKNEEIVIDYGYLPEGYDSDKD